MKTIVNNLKTIFVEFIAQTEDLKNFNFLINQNRLINKAHVKTIKESFEQFGTASVVINVVETKAFGVVERYVADGQHRLTAAIELSLPLSITVVRLEEDTILNLTKYIAMLNNTSKGWGSVQYMSSFANSEGGQDYNVLKTLTQKSGLKASDMVAIFLDNSSEQRKAFISGNMVIENKENKMFLYKAVVKVKSNIPNKAFVRRAFIKVMKTLKTEQYNKMAKAVVEASKKMAKAHTKFSENEAEFFEHMERIKKATFKKK